MTTTDNTTQQCPDRGACHHGCGAGPCFRVQFCGPLSGVYPSNRWPGEVLDDALRLQRITDGEVDTTPEPYTPTDEDMRKRHRHAWEQSPVNRHALEEADAQWSRWLAAHDARVRRDTAREALDGLAAQEERHCDEQKLNPNGYHIHSLIADSARIYRDTHYPEETP